MNNMIGHGNMRPMTLDSTSEDGNPHWLYDLSIIDVVERKEKRQWFSAAHKLANFIGVPPKTIYCKRTIGTKIFSPRFNRWYAIRFVHVEKNTNEQKDSTC